MGKYIISLSDEKKTSSLGAELAMVCTQACTIYLYGNIGVGKTTFCRGFLRALGYIGHVKSPTYIFIEAYTLLRWTVYHLDLYRLENAEELEYMGIRDYFNNTAIYLVEWPQIGLGMLPSADIILTLYYQANGRKAEIQALSTTGLCILDQLSFSSK